MSHTESRLQLTFEDEQQLKIDGLEITGRLRRPASDRYDQTLTFNPAGAGVYASPVQLLPGVWEVDVDAAGRDGHAYRKTFRFVVKG
jgi:nitrogen fixation protein FixH